MSRLKLTFSAAETRAGKSKRAMLERIMMGCLTMHCFNPQCSRAEGKCFGIQRTSASAKGNIARDP